MNTEAATNQPPLPAVAVLGLGTMGSGIAQRLLDQGFSVGVWNRTAGPAARLAESGATAYSDAGLAVAAADVVLTMLPNGEAVEEVMIRQGVLDHFRPGAIWVQMGTIGLEATQQLVAEVARRWSDIRFVDAPVSGSREPARTGRLMILASGPDQARATLAPVFAGLGQRTLWLGPAGMGTRLKLVLNTWLAFEVEAAAEAGALAARLNLSPATLVDAVSGGPLASQVALAKLAKMESGDNSADFSLQWALKDLDLATTAVGPAPVPVAGTIADRWRQLVSRGYGDLDISAAGLGLDATEPRVGEVA
jgi:3-hydroxyisobutyrate dehydrogenase